MSWCMRLRIALVSTLPGTTIANTEWIAELYRWWETR